MKSLTLGMNKRKKKVFFSKKMTKKDSRLIYPNQGKRESFIFVQKYPK